jgi:hypothetical protein
MHRYEQVTGRWYNGARTLLGRGYSGRGPDKNNPASEGKEGLGPIPRGRYTIVGPLYYDLKLGRDVLKLIPHEQTAKRISAMGREPFTFRLHGDNYKMPGEASDGCIIEDHNVRLAIAADTDDQLEVVSGLENSDTDRPARPTAV